MDSRVGWPEVFFHPEICQIDSPAGDGLPFEDLVALRGEERLGGQHTFAKGMGCGLILTFLVLLSRESAHGAVEQFPLLVACPFAHGAQVQQGGEEGQTDKAEAA